MGNACAGQCCAELRVTEAANEEPALDTITQNVGAGVKELATDTQVKTGETLATLEETAAEVAAAVQETLGEDIPQITEGVPQGTAEKVDEHVAAVEEKACEAAAVVQETLGEDIAQITEGVAQGTAAVTTAVVAPSMTITFESKGRALVVEFTEKPLAFEYSLQKKQGCLCASGAKARIVVTRVDTQAGMKGVKVGMIITKVNDEEVKPDTEFAVFDEMIGLAAKTLLDPSAAAVDPAATCPN